MKKVILFFVILVMFLTMALMNTKVAYAWDDCPKGMVNDEYPGSCPRYIDTDGNGICDHSEPAPEDRADAAKTSAPDALVNNDATKNLNSVTENTNFKTTPSYVIILSIVLPLVAILSYATMRNKSV